MNSITPKHTLQLLAIGILTGILFCLLRYWRVNFIPAPIFIATFALLFSFAFDGRNLLRLLLSTLIVATFITLALPFDILRQCMPQEIFFLLGSGFFFVAMLNVFHMAFHRVGNFSYSYPLLFALLWDSLALIVIIFLFMGLFWMILWFTALSFELLNIHGVYRFIFNPYFILSTSPILANIGIAIGRTYPRLIELNRAFLLLISRILFPLVVVAGLAFLGTFLVISIKEGAHGFFAGDSIILVSYALMSIIFFNALYQDGEKKYSWVFEVLSAIYLLTLPIFTIFNFYSRFIKGVHLPGMEPNNFYWDNYSFLLLMVNLYTCAYAVYGLANLWNANNHRLLQNINVYLAYAYILLFFILNNIVFQYIHYHSCFTSQKLITTSPLLPPMQPQGPRMENNKLRITSLINQQLAATHWQWLDQKELHNIHPWINLQLQGQNPVYACRGYYNQGIHPGILVGSQCMITYGGQILYPDHFELLAGDPHYANWEGDYQPHMQDFIAGYEPVQDDSGQYYRPLYFCRTMFANQIQIGKKVVYACNFAWQGKEGSVANIYQILRVEAVP